VKLLVVSQYFWPENFRINDLVAGLRARGHEVTVLTGWPNYPDGEVFPSYSAEPGDFARFEGAEVIRVPLVPRGRNTLMLALNYLSFALSATLLGPWRLRGRCFDAVFVFQTSPVTAALPALLLGRLKRAPVSMWILDLWPDTLQAIGAVRSPWLLGAVGALVRFIYRRCGLILVQSQAFLPNVARYGARADQVRYFPNWVEPTFARGLEGISLAVELGGFRDTFNVMFAGNIGEAQDLPSVLDAADRTRDIDDLRWLIVGEGRAAGHLREEIVRRGLGDRVILLGRHPVERMPGFFVGADALLVSLKREPIWAMTVPGKVQSYLAAGKPVLAMLDGEGARVVSDSGGGLVSPAGDGAALAENVRRLRAMPEKQRRSLGQNGRDYARREFDREALFSRLETWLAERGT
jgi:colanic acid biosynthesis glycosyl transferase WcaI